MSITMFQSLFDRSVFKSHYYRKITLRASQSLGALALVLNLGIPLAQAGDPFRTSNPAAIGPHTEAAFRAMMERGNYREAAHHLDMAQDAEATDPLVYAMLASLAYLSEDWSALQGHARQTLSAAEALQGSSPLRSHLYTAIGHFLEGAHVLSPAGEGTLRGVPTALSKLEAVYGALGEAKKIDPNDPELNLIQGFMDLQIAVNLPLTSPRKAIERLEANAAPEFIADWGIALAYRDLDKLAEALDRVNGAIVATNGQNPQLYHLRAQIFRKQGEAGDPAAFDRARADFEKALMGANNLPSQIVGEIAYEYCRNQANLDQMSRDCGAFKRAASQTTTVWGPEVMPVLEGLTPDAEAEVAEEDASDTTTAMEAMEGHGAEELDSAGNATNEATN